jgi:hypothetical protein
VAASVASPCQHGEAFARLQPGRVARQRGDAVAALQRFGQQRAADEAGGADQQQVHGILQIRLNNVGMMECWLQPAR